MTKTDIVRRNLAHVGIILCHLSIAGFLFVISSFLSTIAIILAFLLGLMIIVITVGTIFAIIPDYWDKLMSFMDGSGKFIEIVTKWSPTIGVVSIILCASSIVLLSFDLKWDKSKPRMIISCINMLFLLSAVILLLISISRGEA